MVMYMIDALHHEKVIDSKAPEQAETIYSHMFEHSGLLMDLDDVPLPHLTFYSLSPYFEQEIFINDEEEKTEEKTAVTKAIKAILTETKTLTHPLDEAEITTKISYTQAQITTKISASKALRDMAALYNPPPNEATVHYMLYTKPVKDMTVVDHGFEELEFTIASGGKFTIASGGD